MKTYQCREVVVMVREQSTLPVEMGSLAKVKITRSDTVARLFRELKDMARETFCILLLDGKNRVQGLSVISIGSLTASMAHPREVFRPAVLDGAVSILCVHNHPGGDPEPSAEDIKVTKRLVESGRILGIRVLDHVIVSESGHYSFADRGMIGG